VNLVWKSIHSGSFFHFATKGGDAFDFFLSGRTVGTFSDVLAIAGADEPTTIGAARTGRVVRPCPWATKDKISFASVFEYSLRIEASLPAAA
jgi:hypothetical protein